MDVVLVMVVVIVVIFGGDVVLNVIIIFVVVVRVLEIILIDVNKFGKLVEGNDGLLMDIMERLVGVNIFLV